MIKILDAIIDFHRYSSTTVIKLDTISYYNLINELNSTYGSKLKRLTEYKGFHIEVNSDYNFKIEVL